MILDKNGKLFGKISIIDLFAILVILVAIVGFGIRFFGPNSEYVTGRTKISYVVKIEEVREFTVAAIEKKGIAKDKKSGTVIGNITDVERELATEPQIDANGNLVMARIPDKFNAYVTVEAVCKETDKSYILGENIELTVGSTVTMGTKYANSSGKVISIDVIE